MAKFTIVSAGCNCCRFLGDWYKSIVNQSYKNWVCMVNLDASSDDSEKRLLELTGNDSRFDVVVTNEKRYLLKNTYDCIKRETDPESVIVTLDLDDRFNVSTALERVAKEYEDPSCWLTYGSYVDSNGGVALFCKEIPDEVWSDNSHRMNFWSASQLRTFKKWLWDKIDPKDFLMPDGTWIKRATDRAFMYPMLEMAGKKHVRLIRDIIYYYNIYGQQPKTHDIEMEALGYILSKHPYKTINGNGLFGENMMMNQAIIMSEPPAKCNFTCDYCYIPPNFDRRLDKKQVTGNDYLRLAAKTNADSYLFWLCAIGEPFMMPYIREVITTLSKEHKVCVVTNLSFYGNDTPEYLTTLDFNQRKNIGMYWSVHWNQMKKHRVLERTLERAKLMKDAGIRIWPTIVMHPSYFNVIDEVLAAMNDLDLKISFCRYRIGQGDLAGLEEENSIYDKFNNHQNVDFRIWNITPECWEVAGGHCMAGMQQVIIDAWWRMCTCHGDGNSAHFFGTFPEDIERIQLTTPDVCKATKCPCKHSVFYGVNSKFPHTFADILEDWEGFIEA